MRRQTLHRNKLHSIRSPNIETNPERNAKHQMSLSTINLKHTAGDYEGRKINESLIISQLADKVMRP
jgi:hypothetical protein